jgi:hypothetical protein
MFVVVVVLIVLFGAAAILYTIEGAMSGRSLTIGLVLAGAMLLLQGGAIVYSAVNPAPASVSDSQAPAADQAQPSTSAG